MSPTRPCDERRSCGSGCITTLGLCDEQRVEGREVRGCKTLSLLASPHLPSADLVVVEAPNAIVRGVLVVVDALDLTESVAEGRLVELPLPRNLGAEGLLGLPGLPPPAGAIASLASAVCVAATSEESYGRDCIGGKNHGSTTWRCCKRHPLPDGYLIFARPLTFARSPQWRP